jgi:hypothetical protein
MFSTCDPTNLQAMLATQFTVSHNGNRLQPNKTIKDQIKDD